VLVFPMNDELDSGDRVLVGDVGCGGDFSENEWEGNSCLFVR